MTSQRESDLNLIQMRSDLLPTSDAVVDAFIKQQPRRMFLHLYFLSDTDLSMENNQINRVT